MAGKKKQIEIPQTCTSWFVGMSKKELREWSKSYYSSTFIGKKVKNLDLGIEISFKRLGSKKTSYGAAMYPKKAAAIMILDKMLEQAVHTNWGERKENDPINVIAYCNFKCKILIETALRSPPKNASRKSWTSSTSWAKRWLWLKSNKWVAQFEDADKPIH